ncbi:iron chelate uptake ABC transporter family permease subunit, partial [Bacillus subtilis]|uniref:iron chelate uptake ABC transporter family permease subunit n=1 Tax=Bacillus subtilis TaxID=1423 RepID=UPI00338E4483
MTPLNLPLSPIALHFFLSSITHAIIILNHSPQNLLYSITPPIHPTNSQHLITIPPFSLIPIPLPLLFSPSLSLLRLAHETPKPLAQNINAIPILITLIILILS